MELAIAITIVLSFVPAQARAQLEERDVLPVVLAGRVLAPDGSPAHGALVETSAGGRAVTAVDGAFELAVELPVAAPAVDVTASAAGGSLAAEVRIVPASLAGTTQIGMLVLAPTASCQARWVRTFGGLPGMDDDVHAVAVFDDMLYAGGTFTTASSAAANFIARWEGNGWDALAGGALNGQVDALTVHDDGSGLSLYVGGEFTSAGGNPVNHIARWNGSSWSALGAGLDGAVHSFFEYDDGSGPALYVGGTFTHAGGNPAKRIARWDGSTWTTLGGGFSGGILGPSIEAMAVFDDGNGPAFYAAGAFTQADGAACPRIARWNGASWVSVGGGLTSDIFDVQAHSLAVFDDGSGPALYVGGRFMYAGGVAARGLAKWDGSAWHSLATGMATSDAVHDLILFNDGSGAALYAGGEFETAGGVSAHGIVRWDGAIWTGLGVGVGGLEPVVHALAAFDDGNGQSLVAGGAFTLAGAVAASRVAKWNGAWSELGRGKEIGVGGQAPFDVPTVDAVAVFDDGRGPALYAAGTFIAAGPLAANRIARWDGTRWEALGSGTNYRVRALAVFDDGNGPALYAGGDFTQAGSVTANGIARWDGVTWSALGGGLVSPGVRALAVFNDGSGSALYAGGIFDLANGGVPNGTPVKKIAKWNGVSWSPLCQDVQCNNFGVSGPGLSGSVLALAVFDDGAGEQLYVAGTFTQAANVPAARIAKWSGSSWSAVGAGVDGTVSALTVFDDGSGPALYLGGSFTLAGGAPIARITKWDGTSWASLGTGVNDTVQALVTFDDGSGPALYAGGRFTIVDGVAMNRIARWDGASWSALASGVNDDVLSFGVFDPGTGPGLYCGGEFKVSPAGDRRLARWACAARVRRKDW